MSACTVSDLDSTIFEEFEIFLKKNGIQHSTSSAYHPSSNSLVERAVQIFKDELKEGERRLTGVQNRQGALHILYHTVGVGSNLKVERLY